MQHVPKVTSTPSSQRPGLQSQVTSVTTMIADNQYHEEQDLFKLISYGPANPTDHPTYATSLAAQDEFKLVAHNAVQQYNIDAVVFPDTQGPAVTHAEILEGRSRV